MARQVRSIKFSEEEWAKVEARAEREGLPASTFVREVAVGNLEAESLGARREILCGMRRNVALMKEVLRAMEKAPYGADHRGLDRDELHGQTKEIMEVVRRVDHRYGRAETEEASEGAGGGEETDREGETGGTMKESFMEVS